MQNQHVTPTHTKGAITQNPIHTNPATDQNWPDTNGFWDLKSSVSGCWGDVVVLLPALVTQSTQDLGNLAHHYFILYLHLFPLYAYW